MNKKSIYVTQPFLPELKDFFPYLQKIWETKKLTNGGDFHQEFEEKLCNYLGVKYISLFTNGTLALITALQSLKILGEVITTPFSFVATSHSLWWNNIKPVFVDIDPYTCNLDPEKIEAAITPQTTAILPVHVYGNPCNVERIQKIADVYGLKVIYDAAHAFGVKIKDKSILNYGDLSILSFHATKTFNTFEGGAIICYDEKMKRRIDDLKNFGIHDETTVVAPGVNAKMNEFQAALGILQLKYIDSAIKKRKEIVSQYQEALKNQKGICLLKNQEDVKYNYSYFPIFITEKFNKTRNELYETLKQNNIFTRRYFYPLISDFPTYRGFPSANRNNLQIATKIAEQVLCLPLYPDLEKSEINRIIHLILK